MKRYIYVILLAITLAVYCVSSGEVFADTDFDGFVKVRLTRPLKSDNSVNLYCDSGFSIFNLNDLENEIDFLDVKEIYATLDDEGSVSLFDKDNNLIYNINCDDNLAITCKDVSERKIKVENIYYRGYILFNSIQDKLYVINYVDLEEYLYGVLPKEMSYSFHEEALKAQAIAARTYAIRNLNKHIEEGYNLCDTVDCQAYGGLNVENSKTNKAVDDTKGIIMTYDGYPIYAVYHSNSGGHTADAEEIWGSYIPYLIGVEDEFSSSYPNSRWQIKITSEEISYKLYRNNIDVGKVLDIIIMDTSSHGRVSKLKIVGDKGEEVISGNYLRSLIGETVLKSTYFTVEKENVYEDDIKVYSIYEDDYIRTIDLDNINVVHGDGNISTIDEIDAVITENGVETLDFNRTPVEINFHIDGKGYGHGVGMSQWGAQGMAVNGYSFEEILKYYYRGINIELKQ